LRFAEVSGPAWMQWVLFSIASIAMTALFRRRFVERLNRTPSISDLDTLVGGRANAVEKIDAGSMGRVEMRGTAWQARNVGAESITAGEECRVEKVDGLVLAVRAAKGGV
jgi:membrane protein implicated in regulation of membrane protease activity